MVHLGPDVVAQARAAALKLEERAYRISDVYQQTSPAEQLPSTSGDLSIDKSDPADPGRVGTPLTYTLAVSNGGPDAATNVTVTDALPGAVAYRSATTSQGSCARSARTVTCSLGTIASGGSATVKIEVTSSSVGSVTNSASVSSDAADPDPSDNSDAEVTAVRRRAGKADLAVRLEDERDPARVGRPLPYEILVKNLDEGDATGVTLVDRLPSGVTFVSARVRRGTCADSGGVVTCSLGSLAEGKRVEVEIVVTPTAPGHITNTVEVFANETDPHTGNNRDSETTTVR